MYPRYVKRLVDIVVSCIVLILASPLLLVVALALHRVNHGPILFYQVRPGLHGVPFRIIKFKTMSDERGPDGELLPDPQRMTRLGRIVRQLSIDELLQLVNVLKGDMSLIGPRPLLPEYLPFYSEREMHRHDVRPGISGLAQVSGRNALNWHRRLRYDTFYVTHMSMGLDARIFLQTLIKVVRANDINPDYEHHIVRFDDYVQRTRQRGRLRDLRVAHSSAALASA